MSVCLSVRPCRSWIPKELNDFDLVNFKKGELCASVLLGKNRSTCLKVIGMEVSVFTVEMFNFV